MDRMRATAGVLVLMLETGCPVGGDAGVLHQAMLKDSIKRLAGDSCQEDDIRDECGPKYEECLASCLEEMRKRAQK